MSQKAVFLILCYEIKFQIKALFSYEMIIYVFRFRFLVFYKNKF